MLLKSKSVLLFALLLSYNSAQAMNYIDDSSPQSLSGESYLNYNLNLDLGLMLLIFVGLKIKSHYEYRYKIKHNSCVEFDSVIALDKFYDESIESQALKDEILNNIIGKYCYDSHKCVIKLYNSKHNLDCPYGAYYYKDQQTNVFGINSDFFYNAIENQDIKDQLFAILLHEKGHMDFGYSEKSFNKKAGVIISLIGGVVYALITQFTANSVIVFYLILLFFEACISRYKETQADTFAAKALGGKYIKSLIKYFKNLKEYQERHLPLYKQNRWYNIFSNSTHPTFDERILHLNNIQKELSNHIASEFDI